MEGAVERAISTRIVLEKIIFARSERTTTGFLSKNGWSCFGVSKAHLKQRSSSIYIIGRDDNTGFGNPDEQSCIRNWDFIDWHRLTSSVVASILLSHSTS